MKKILCILLFMILILISCNPRGHYIVDDEYTVIKVEYYPNNPYNLKYKIIAMPINKTPNTFTFFGNRMKYYYTNTFYSIEDTIRLINTKSLK